MLKNEALIVEFQHLGQMNQKKKKCFGISEFPPPSVGSHHIEYYLTICEIGCNDYL